MKKIGWKIYTLFAVTFVTTLIITAPATLLSRVVESSSDGQFVLSNAGGTIWSGSASPTIRQRSGNLYALEKLHWNISLMQLWGGKIIVRLNWENVEQAQPILVTISYQQIELRNVLFPLKAGVLGELLPMLRPVQLSGKMQISSEQLILTKQGIKGNAVADWTNAGSVLSAVNPLGNYRLNLSGMGDRLDLTLLTVSGALLLEGKGSYTQSQGLRLQATARAAEDSKAMLVELLSNLGPESAPGVHTLNLMR